MAAITEARHAGEFILSEGNGSISREVVTVASGVGKLAAGTVLGKVTTGGKYKPSPATGSTGEQTAVAVLFDAIDATSADVTAVVIARNAEINGNTLAYDSSVDDATKKAAKATQLAAVGIIVR